MFTYTLRLIKVDLEVYSGLLIIYILDVTWAQKGLRIFFLPGLKSFILHFWLALVDS